MGVPRDALCVCMGGQCGGVLHNGASAPRACPFELQIVACTDQARATCKADVTLPVVAALASVAG